jgi:hypothetical protein
MFKDVVESIKRSEKDVDKVLKAARLQRIESGKMSDGRFDRIMSLVEGALFGLGALGFMALFFWFLTTSMR